MCKMLCAHAVNFSGSIFLDFKQIPERPSPHPNINHSSEKIPSSTVPHELTEGFIVGKCVVVLLGEHMLHILQAPGQKQRS